MFYYCLEFNLHSMHMLSMKHWQKIYYFTNGIVTIFIYSELRAMEACSHAFIHIVMPNNYSSFVHGLKKENSEKSTKINWRKMPKILVK